MQITREFLKQKGACTDGYRYFCEKFDDNAEYNDVLKGLSEDKKLDYIHWLIEKVGKEERINDLNGILLNSGDWNSGYGNSGNMNSGYGNSGDRNSGNRNSGYGNSGNMNSGNMNSGNRNSGYGNSGNMNSGNRNSGDWNKTNYSNGVFNTAEPTIHIFDMPSNMTYSQWNDHKARYILNRMMHTQWIFTENMTDAEKELHPEHETTGGYLKTLDRIEAAEQWLQTLTDEQKEIIRSIPNFDADKFESIVGVKI